MPDFVGRVRAAKVVSDARDAAAAPTNPNSQTRPAPSYLQVRALHAPAAGPAARAAEDGGAAFGDGQVGSDVVGSSASSGGGGGHRRRRCSYLGPAAPTTGSAAAATVHPPSQTGPSPTDDCSEETSENGDLLVDLLDASGRRRAHEVSAAAGRRPRAAVGEGDASAPLLTWMASLVGAGPAPPSAHEPPRRKGGDPPCVVVNACEMGFRRFGHAPSHDAKPSPAPLLAAAPSTLAAAPTTLAPASNAVGAR